MKPWQNKTVPILCYHRVVPASLFNTKHRICVEIQSFKEQMKFLASKGYTTISLDMLIDSLNGKTQLPQKPIIITFDDGYQDNYLYAFPILMEYNFTATIYLVSGYIGDTNQWDKCVNEKPVKLLSKAEIKEMSKYGISFGAHTVTHPHLTKLSKEKAFYEIIQSKKDIEDIIGQEVTSFCYPYGKFNSQIKQMVMEAGFKCACAGSVGKSDIFALRREQIFPNTNLFGFWRKTQRWYPWYKRLKKANSSSPKRILVVRNDRMGDLILTLPTISALRKEYPDAHIAILIQPYVQDILYKNQDLDEIILDKNLSIFKLANEIKKKKFDMCIILHPTWRNGWICWLSKIPLRIGTGYKPVGILFNKRVYIHRTKVIHHEIDYCLKLAEKAGVQIHEKGKINLWIKDEDKLYIQELLKKYQLLDNFPLIGIHPGSGGSALNWPEHAYAKLIDSVSNEYNIKVILTGSKEEDTLVKRIISMTSTQPVNLVGQTTLGQLMALFSFYHLFIGSSTGPMHLAAALGKPVIALFPPIPSQSPDKWGPYGENHTILSPEGIECHYKRCKAQKCRFYNCMEQITPEKVLEAVKKQIGLIKKDLSK